jgi:hypothetical protein
MRARCFERRAALVTKQRVGRIVGLAVRTDHEARSGKSLI